MTDSVLGMASAKSEALKMGKRNIEVSAPMIVELVDRIEELEKLIGQVYEDLYVRAEFPEDGGVVFNLSHFLVIKLKENRPRL